MGMDCGVSGAFGLLLSNCAGKKPIERLTDELIDALVHWEEEEGPAGYSLDHAEAYEQIAGRFVERFIQAFKEMGIIIPKGAGLHWTGSGDDRPARCDAPANDWVLGFGLLTRPWNYPRTFHKSFREAATFHTWVWMG